MRILIILLALALTPTFAFSAYYKWTDEEGLTHITDDFYKVPEHLRNKTKTNKKSSASAAASMKPEKVYEAYFKAMKGNKFDNAKEHMSKDLINKISDRWSGRLDEALKAMRSVLSSNVRVTDVKITGKKATAMAWGLSGQHESWADIEFIKEDGAWKITKETWH